jgi:two-component system cell cycle response regulator DivK
LNDVNKSDPLVLLVDDFTDGREMYEEYLTFRGIRVVTADSGTAAVLLANGADRPAVILMDLEMRGMSGTIAMRTLRQNPLLASVPILAFTAHALEAERQKAILDGFDAVIPKPCLPDQLVALIEPYLAQSRNAIT